MIAGSPIFTGAMLSRGLAGEVHLESRVALHHAAGGGFIQTDHVILPPSP